MNSETILFAEDEDLLRKMISRLLREHGYRVVESCNGTEALATAAAHRGPIDLLLTDIVMPGLSGPDLAKQLRARRPEIQVLYVSGHLGQADLEPGSSFLGKPFTPQELLDAIRSALAGAVPRGAA